MISSIPKRYRSSPICNTDLKMYRAAGKEELKRALSFIERETHLRTKSFRMLSDGVQGEFLRAFSLMVAPRSILEIGTFTGYATLSLCAGLHPEGMVHTIEKDDELTDIFHRGFAIASLQDRIRTYSGDAMEIIPRIEGTFDIVYIDADKRVYGDFFNLVKERVVKGGWILADNVDWSGKIYSEKDHKDRQTASIIAFRDMILRESGFRTAILPIRDGLAVMKKL